MVHYPGSPTTCDPSENPYVGEKNLKFVGEVYKCKVREPLEIQLNECGPNKGGLNLDDG